MSDKTCDSYQVYENFGNVLVVLEGNEVEDGETSRVLEFVQLNSALVDVIEEAELIVLVDKVEYLLDVLFRNLRLLSPALYKSQCAADLLGLLHDCLVELKATAVIL